MHPYCQFSALTLQVWPCPIIGHVLACRQGRRSGNCHNRGYGKKTQGRIFQTGREMTKQFLTCIDFLSGCRVSSLFFDYVTLWGLFVIPDICIQAQCWKSVGDNKNISKSGWMRCSLIPAWGKGERTWEEKERERGLTESSSRTSSLELETENRSF